MAAASGALIPLPSSRRGAPRPAQDRPGRRTRRPGRSCAGRGAPRRLEGSGMSAPDAAAMILWVGATLYAVFGGADFGAGIWDLLARGEQGPRARALLERSLTPVWEANHVWLIFCLVVLWTAFPEAFGAIMSTLFIPLFIAALGIVLRGAGFAFRHAITAPRAGRRLGLVFSLSSLLTPLAMGTVVGAIACGL